MCACVCRLDLRWLLQFLSTLSLRQRLSLNLEFIHLSRHTSQWAAGICLCWLPQKQLLIQVTLHDLSTDAGETNSGPCACATSILLTWVISRAAMNLLLEREWTGLLKMENPKLFAQIKFWGQNVLWDTDLSRSDHLKALNEINNLMFFIMLWRTNTQKS